MNLFVNPFKHGDKARSATMLSQGKPGTGRVTANLLILRFFVSMAFVRFYVISSLRRNGLIHVGIFHYCNNHIFTHFNGEKECSELLCEKSHVNDV